MTDITTKLRSGEFTGSAAKIERLEWSEHDGMIPVSDGDYVRATDHDATIAAKANEIDRLRAEVAGKDAEIARLQDRMACLKEFRMDGLGVDMSWTGDAANALMQMLAAMMIDVPNYLESTMTIAGHGESYVMTIRKHDGKTPHAMRAEADAKVARLREALAVFVHAHHSGNSAPPHIVEQARAALTEDK